MKILNQENKMFAPFSENSNFDYEYKRTLGAFKKQMVERSTTYINETIAELFLRGIIKSPNDLKTIPIYLGYYGEKKFGVFVNRITEIEGEFEFNGLQTKEFEWPTNWNISK